MSSSSQERPSPEFLLDSQAPFIPLQTYAYNEIRYKMLSYTQPDEANRLLARNHGVIASFSRALTEGLTAQQSEEEFNRALDASIASIYEASGT